MTCLQKCMFSFLVKEKRFYYLLKGPSGTKGILLSNKVYLVGEKATTINIFVNSF